MKVSLFFILFALIWDTASAGGLKPASTISGTGVLPKGISSPRIRHYNINLGNKITDERVSQPIAEAMNQKVTWNQVLESREGYQKTLFKESLEAMGLDLKNGGPGSLVNDVNVGLNVSVPIFGYGLTDKASIGVIVPVYQVETSVATGFNVNEQGRAWINTVASPSTQQQAKKALDNALNNTLTSMGYDPVESESFTSLGDIQIAYKYRLYNDKRHGLLWENYLITPTGRQPDPDKLTDVPTGDGQWDLSTGLVYQFKTYIPFTSLPFSYSLIGSYTHQFADTIEKRIPENEGSPLSADKEEVDRKLGDQFRAGVGFTLGNTRDGSSFGAAYDYQYSLPTTYEGSQFEKERYSWLEDLEGESELQSITMAYSYSTIEAFRRKQFFAPMTATLSYARPLSGKNVNDTEIYFGELIVYF